MPRNQSLLVIPRRFLHHQGRLFHLNPLSSFRGPLYLKDNSSIFDFAVEREIESFTRQSLEKKKHYLVNRLKLTRQDEVWTLEGREWWKEIDEKRNLIVHEEAVPEISSEYLLNAIYYVHRLMVSTAVFAQAEQGVRFTFPVLSDYVICREKPRLR
jgi:hypothetical protein